jgi:hypothetical protein
VESERYASVCVVVGVESERGWREDTGERSGDGVGWGGVQCYELLIYSIGDSSCDNIAHQPRPCSQSLLQNLRAPLYSILHSLITHLLALPPATHIYHHRPSRRPSRRKAEQTVDSSVLAGSSRG